MTDPTYISDTDQVRKLARSVVPGDFTNDQIVEEQKAAYSDIIIATTKSDWSATDNRFAGVQKIEQELAAAYLIEYYGSGTPEEINMIELLRAKAANSITSIKENTTDPEEDVNILVDASNYVSYGAMYNEDPTTAEIYRSTTSVV